MLPIILPSTQLPSPKIKVYPLNVFRNYVQVHLLHVDLVVGRLVEGVTVTAAAVALAVVAVAAVVLRVPHGDGASRRRLGTGEERKKNDWRSCEKLPDLGAPRIEQNQSRVVLIEADITYFEAKTYPRKSTTQRWPRPRAGKEKKFGDL